MPTLNEVLISKGAEYAPFDTSRAKRIYDAIAPIFGFEKYFGTKCKVIHIIGTNGKGSTGRFITMGLEQYKKSVLHFSSPHLFNFNERFFVSRGDFRGEIPQSRLESIHQKLWAIESVREASYFEYATFLALVLGMEYEYLVLEAGVGGEFDSTSVILANVSVFTLIGLDHQEMLGENIEQIAKTKLKAMSGHTILARQNDKEVENLALEIASQKALRCALWEGMDRILGEQKKAFYDYAERYNLPMFLRENLSNALRVLAFFGMKFDFATLGRLSLRGRCEILAKNIVLDVGHNIDGARALRAFLGDKKVNLVYNSYIEKDIRAILRELLPNIKKVLILSVQNSRICPRQRLVKILESLQIAFMDFDIATMSESETYLIFGSFSVAQEFLQQYTMTTRQGEVQCKIN
ncbi:bifunctional folylpolyglutamate synthase/dihydrofolate synthase [Helicobacter cinaedi]|uniref:Bifunctional protein FolC n=1 Tax=Helicobacter cinaedi CCUG 18818 = ATCC BAA-847 TaxID=537971 RepID=A0AAI8MN89_9HELI|nr:bifunctional folylpolyglutamate synthase/dihydrofolate synthase [Helicobacter cinaedi]EFR47549.1 bifunctional protein FolC [Helicobacter cinaedi CCUG 18818 = ATCC BAA-847]QOQ91372.1 bifunctional folylpolyglutamate synthase/dihydrofolate synthase [Helicobacter cinaedi]BAM32616.1 folylpolyglutamate synthase [Helicobacter cinaedi CCUG 18818 = ATCC BAA-847]